MKKLSSGFLSLCCLTGLVLGAVGPGCSKDSEPDTTGSRMVPRPTSSDAAPANSVDECEPQEECTGAASCQATCGLHELGDRACMCTSNALTCTGCTLNAEFAPMMMPATEFCPAGIDDDDPCTTKGATCIDIAYNNAGVPRREGCLCWQGRMRLEWDCSQNINEFFKDMAPATPPPRDGGVTPPPPATTQDAAAAG